MLSVVFISAISLFQTLVTSSDPNPHPKSPHANAIPLGIRISTYEFGEREAFRPWQIVPTLHFLPILEFEARVVVVQAAYGNGMDTRHEKSSPQRSVETFFLFLRFPNQPG